ncbi:wax ester/triacylglycerol synthase family O-acyltransferase [Cryptosporidium felis]|nr:wax ester/triacylglycerol synthase family O-acyltransferase [Cryptosporidium felis]
MLKLLYLKFKSLLKTVYFIPLEAGWVSVLISLVGSLVLAPVVTIAILITHLFKLLDMLWIKLSYIWCSEKNLLLEPLNDVDYLIWKTSIFGQPLIMCFFVTDQTPSDYMEDSLIWRIESRDAFGESGKTAESQRDQKCFHRRASQRSFQGESLPNAQRKNKRFFCTVESYLGRLWFKFAKNDYDTSKNIVKLTPAQVRLIIKSPELIVDGKSLTTLSERVSYLEKRVGGEENRETLKEEEMREFYNLLFTCEASQLSVKRPCWRIILLDDVIWNGAKSSILVGQFHHVIGDGSTLTEFVSKTILDGPGTNVPREKKIKGVTRSAKFWHQWVNGLLWAAIAGPITLLKASLQARPERSWDSPLKKRSQRSNKVASAGPLNLSLSEVNLLKDRLNENLKSGELAGGDGEECPEELNNYAKIERQEPNLCSTMSRRGKRKSGETTQAFVSRENNKESHRFSKRITFNDIILSCIASGYSKYVNFYISGPDHLENASNSSTSTHSPASHPLCSSSWIERDTEETGISTSVTPSSRGPEKNSEKENGISSSASQSLSPSSFHFDDKSPYSSVLKYDSITNSQDLDADLELFHKRLAASPLSKRRGGKQLSQKLALGSTQHPGVSKDAELSTLCHSNLNVVVTTNNRVKPPTKLDNAFSTIVLPIPTCPLASPFERLKCVFESLQEYRKTSLPIIFIRYIKYTISLSPYALLFLWRPHSKSCSMYYSSVPGPKNCSFMSKTIRDMTFALPLTDHIGLGISVFSFEDIVSISCTFDEEIIINPSLLLESIRLSFEELKEGVLT